MSKEEVSRLLDRGSKDAQQIKASVSSIIKRVEEEGDRALFELERELDSCELSSLNVSEKEFEEAEQNLDPALKHSIELAIENVKNYQKRLLPPSLWLESFANGIIAGEKVSAIESVGLYVPRGKGSFPSVMIMLGVPARVAGVKRIVVATPPDRYGKVDEKVLYVCKKLGIKEVYTLPKNIGKGVRNVDFKLALTDETLNYLLALRDIGLLSKEEITVGKSRVRPFDVVLRLVPQPSSLLDLKGVSCVVIEVEGVDKRGKVKKHKLFVAMSHEEAYTKHKVNATSYLTGVGAAAGALLMLSGNRTPYGVLSPEELDAKRYFEILKELGVCLSHLVSDGEIVTQPKRNKGRKI